MTINCVIFQIQIEIDKFAFAFNTSKAIILGEGKIKIYEFFCNNEGWAELLHQKEIEYERYSAKCIKLIDKGLNLIIANKFQELESWRTDTRTSIYRISIPFGDIESMSITRDEQYVVIINNIGCGVFSTVNGTQIHMRRMDGINPAVYLDSDSILYYNFSGSMFYPLDFNKAGVKQQKFWVGDITTASLARKGMVYIGMNNGIIKCFDYDSWQMKELERRGQQIIKFQAVGDVVYAGISNGDILYQRGEEWVLKTGRPNQMIDFYIGSNQEVISVHKKQVLFGNTRFYLNMKQYVLSHYYAEFNTLVCARNDFIVDIFQLGQEKQLQIQLRYRISSMCGYKNMLCCNIPGNLEFWHLVAMDKIFHIPLPMDVLLAKMEVVFRETGNVLIGVTQNSLVYISINDRLLLANIPFSQYIYSFALMDPYICVYTCNELQIVDNWLHSKKINIQASNEGLIQLKNTLSKFFKRRRWTTSVPQEITSIVIFPHMITIAHIFAYYTFPENTSFTELAQVSTADGDTPLSIAFIRNNKEVAEGLIQHLCQTASEENNKFFMVDNTLTQLNKVGFEGLTQLYEHGFQRITKQRLPKYCINPKNLPVMHRAMSNQIDLKNFEHNLVFSGDGQSVQFMTSFFRVPLIPGSRSSIKFLESLYDCSAVSIFRTQFVEYVVQYKWRMVRWILYLQAVVYVVYLALLSFLLLSVHQEFWHIISIGLVFFVNLFLIAYEIAQIILTGKEYFEDMWNYLDIIRCIAVLPYSVNPFYPLDEVTNTAILFIITVFSFFRGISYFRLYSRTRYQVYMIIQVMLDMRAFLTILLYFVFTFAMIQLSLPQYFPQEHQFDYITETYMIVLGEFGTKPTSEPAWAIFLVFTIVNTIILLNLLISVVSDTYDRVQNELKVVDMRELINLTLEAEYLHWQNRNKNERYFLQVCKGEGDSDSIDYMWEGRVREILNKMDNLVPMMQRSLKEITGIDNIAHVVAAGMGTNLENRLEKLEEQVMNLSRNMQQLDQLDIKLTAIAKKLEVA